MRLIDAEKLAEYKASGISELTEQQKGWNDAIDTIIGETPTVKAVLVAELPYTVWLTHDVVQVVRCKDCKWYYIFNGHDRCDLLDLEARDIKPDWFCADGKKRK